MYKIFTRLFCARPGTGTHQFLLVMKLITLLLFAGLLQASASSYGQKITYHKSRVTMAQMIDEIRKQTGLDVLISSDNMKKIKVRSVNYNNEDINNVMADFLQGLSFDFRIEDKTVLISPKDVSLLHKVKERLIAGFQQITVQGIVTDSIGHPMQGVVVREKGTSNIVLTDQRGTFKIIAKDEKSLITFSHIGFIVTELKAGEVPARIVMHAGVANLREVVINKGYYTEKQALSTGSVSSVSAKEISMQPVTDPIQALIGRVPGLYIQQQSGVPGANSLVRLRGQNSIANGNDPLYVIDGVPYSNRTLTPGAGVTSGPLGSGTGFSNTSAGGLSPFNLLNPNDIESIDVLKDADATAIYGSRGANGVILITTKKGRPGNTLVNVDFSQGVSKVTRTMDLMNAEQYLQMRRQAYANDGIDIPATAYDLNGVWDTTRYTDWQKELIGGTGHYTNAQVSVSGGSESTQFYVGGGFNRHTTVYPGDFADQKGTLNFNLNHSSASNRFQLTLSGGYTHDENNLPQSDLTNYALTLSPVAPAAFNPDGTLNWQTNGTTATWGNPLTYTVRTADATSNGLTSNLTLSYKILPELTFKTNTGYNYATTEQVNITPSLAIAPPNTNNAARRSNNYGNGKSTNWIIEPQLNYIRKIGRGELNVLAGTSFQSQYTNSASYLTSGYASDALLTNPANASNFRFFGSTDITYKYTAVYARLNYNWEEKYLLNLTARRDGSSRFGPGKQFGNFGAVGLGWVFSREGFFDNHLDWLSFGKLRASYGVAGNDQITDYTYLSSYSSNSTTYQGITGLYATRIPNAYFAWEVNKKLELGLDLGFLNDRINLTAGYYLNRSGNQLLSYPLGATAGFPSVQANLPAVVRNSGAEFTLNTTNLQRKNFKWSTSVNLTLQGNKLVSYPGLETSNYANVYVEGQSIFISKRYVFAGVNAEDGLYNFIKSSGETTTDPEYPADLMVTKPVTQQYYGLLGNALKYKGLQLDFSFQFVKQQKVNYYGESSVLQSAGTFNYNLPAAMAGNFWIRPGDEALFGRLSTFNLADPGYRSTTSTFGYGDASFIRLKNVSLSYNLPSLWQKTMRLKNVNVYLQGQNLATFSNYFGLDPETGSLGLPPLRTIVFGIHASI